MSECNSDRYNFVQRLLMEHWDSLGTLLAMLALGVVLGYIVGGAAGKQSVQKEAEIRGYGEFVSETLFRWKQINSKQERQHAP